MAVSSQSGNGNNNFWRNFFFIAEYENGRNVDDDDVADENKLYNFGVLKKFNIGHAEFNNPFIARNTLK